MDEENLSTSYSMKPQNIITYRGKIQVSDKISGLAVDSFRFSSKPYYLRVKSCRQ